MAAIDFPNSPAVNDTFTAGNSSYRWTGLAWVSNNLSETTWADISGKPTTFPPSAHTHLLADITDYVEPDSLPTQTGNSGKFLTTNGTEPSWATVTIPPGTTVSDTAPSSPTAGQLWWKSDAGVLYIFYDNFWVEAVVGAVGPTGPAGATGPAGPAGTNGVDAVFQLITAQDFTASTAVNVNNVFSSTYENYKVLVSWRSSGNNTVRLRMRTGGTDYTTNKYFLAGFTQGGTVNEGDSTSSPIGYTDVTGTGATELTFYRPFISTSDTAYTVMHTGPKSGSWVYGPLAGGGGVRENRSDTGFTIYPDSGNITGTIRVYGAKNS